VLHLQATIPVSGGEEPQSCNNLDVLQVGGNSIMPDDLDLHCTRIEYIEL
jgi:hypothetical protein